jgi:DNA-directed RNA polymerase specialized sigma24 family protein
MLSESVPRRPRGLKRAPAAVRDLATREAGRERVRVALERCAEHERAVLALMLFERLTPAEAANALGVQVSELLRAYDSLMRDLRRALKGLRFRPPGSRSNGERLIPEARLRRA